MSFCAHLSTGIVRKSESETCIFVATVHLTRQMLTIITATTTACCYCQWIQHYYLTRYATATAASTSKCACDFIALDTFLQWKKKSQVLESVSGQCRCGPMRNDKRIKWKRRCLYVMYILPHLHKHDELWCKKGIEIAADTWSLTWDSNKCMLKMIPWKPRGSSQKASERKLQFYIAWTSTLFCSLVYCRAWLALLFIFWHFFSSTLNRLSAPSLSRLSLTYIVYTHTRCIFFSRSTHILFYFSIFFWSVCAFSSLLF